MLPLLSQLGYPTALDVLQKRFYKFTQSPGYGVAVAITDNDQIVGLSFMKVLATKTMDIWLSCIYASNSEFCRRLGYSNKLLHRGERVT
jgi:hypothetical protein